MRVTLHARAALAGAFAAALVLGASACGPPDTTYFGRVPDDPDPTHLRWCNSGEPEYLDPAMVSSTTGVKLSLALFDGLTRYNLDGLPEPSIATHWDTDPDQRRFTFHLRRDARWSDGTPITAHDFVYHVVRVLHPMTGSRNAELHWKLRGGELFTANRIRVLLRDAGGFSAGDIVEVVGTGGEVSKEVRKERFPDSNTRAASRSVALREDPRADAEAYDTVTEGATVNIVELSPQRDWAYIYWNRGSGIYGWVPLEALEATDEASARLTVRAINPAHQPRIDLTADELRAAHERDPATRKTGTVNAGDLLLLPEALGVYAPDDYTFVYETNGPLPYMISQTPGRVFRATPRKLVSRWPQHWTRPDRIVTSGPFHLVEWHERDYIRYEKSKTHWDRDNVKLETLTSFNMNDQAAAANYYFTAGCDATTANHVPATYLPVLSGAKRGGKPYADFTAGPYFGIYYYMINVKKHPNVHFRRALSHAVDRRPIPKIVHGGETPTAQFNPGTAIPELTDEELELCGLDSRDVPGTAQIMYPGELCYVPPMGAAFDLEKAREELAIAREQLGDDFPDSITIKFNTGVEMHKIIAEYIQKQWQENLGLDIELESQEWKVYLKDTAAGEFDVGRLGWIGSIPEPEEMIAIFKCDNPNNRSKFCSEEFDRLLGLAERTADRQERLEYIYRAEKIIADETPIIPLHAYTQKHLQKPYVRDLAINRFDRVPLGKAWIDPDWKSREEDD